jgi:hypothetical protein
MDLLSHEEFTEEMISFLRTIGVKTGFLNKPGDLDVKDVETLSESSSIIQLSLL